LEGGLGNQLFQYSAARSLAIKKGTELFIDATGYDTDRNDITKRRNELGLFNIKAQPASPALISKVANRSFAGRVVGKFLPYYRQRYYAERHFHYDPNFSKASSSTILVGFWQSEKYFKDISDTIKEEFLVTAPLSSSTIEVCDRIKNTNSVSLHVRRGDYVSNPATLTYHGVCEPEYYEKALKVIAEKAGEIELFVFADDIEWAKKNIVTSFPVTFVDHNDSLHAYEDLYLMSHCRHNIIANSSFSWWAAWLNNNPGKIVIAPAKWFNESDADPRDLIPEAWIKI
jgi:hypothetical protein